jgi:hypothetical protein
VVQAPLAPAIRKASFCEEKTLLGRTVSTAQAQAKKVFVPLFLKSGRFL